MSEEDFESTDADLINPFNLACGIGLFRIVDLLLTRRKKFVEIPSSGSSPLVYSMLSGHRELPGYIYMRTPLELLQTDYGNSTAVLFRCFIVTEAFDLLLDLFKRWPNVDSTGTSKGEILLFTLANSRELFPSHFHFSFWKRCIYSGIRVKLPPPVPHHVDVRIPIEQDGQMNNRNILIQVLVRLWSSLSESVQQISGYKELYDLKLRHCCAKELLRLALENILTRRQFMKSDLVKQTLLIASENGILEIVIPMLKYNPDMSLFQMRNDDRKSLFQRVIQCRQGKIFSLLLAATINKRITFLSTDMKGNNALQIAGMLASQNTLAKISSPALQMQSELQWFKEVASVSLGGSLIKNYMNEVSSQVFRENHNELKKKGEEWYKGIATSSSVVGALIITIMFTAAFTVPGSNNSNFGLPILLQEKAFKVFIVADAISLFASSSSVLTFLGILTARYEDEDFLESLPRKLIIGLSNLFISIAAMMICFCATVVIMLRGDLKLIIPIVLLASSPVAAFISLQFPLLVDVFNSTYRSDIFDRKMKLE